jgi:hypothetical protein
MGVASEVQYTFKKGTTVIIAKGFESGNSFAFIPATIDIKVAGVKKTVHDVYFPYKIGAPVTQTVLIAFGTAHVYSIDRVENGSTVNVYTT